MSYLWLNTACAPRGLAVVTAKKVALASWWSEPRQDSRQIFAALQTLGGRRGERLDLKVAGVEGIVVVRGPGNFTGLRVGVTVANTLAYAQNLPLYSVTTSEFLWACFPGGPGFIWPAGVSQWFYSRAGGEVQLVAREDTGSPARAVLVDTLSVTEAQQALPAAVAWLVARVSPQKLVVPLYMKEAGVRKVEMGRDLVG